MGLVPPTCLSSRNSVETTQQFCTECYGYYPTCSLEFFTIVHLVSVGVVIPAPLGLMLTSWSELISPSVWQISPGHRSYELLWCGPERGDNPETRLKSKRNGYHCRKGALDRSIIHVDGSIQSITSTIHS